MQSLMHEEQRISSLHKTCVMARKSRCELLAVVDQRNLLAPLGEHMKPKHPLLSLDDEFEEIDLLVGIRPVLGLAGPIDELLEREVGILRRPPHEGGEVHRLLP